MAIYLDTSTVRALGSKLATSAHTDLASSAVTVVELVSAAAMASEDRRFFSAQTALRTLLGGKVSLDWRLPEEPICMAFQWIRENNTFKEERLDSLRGVADSLLASSNRVEFEMKESAASRAYPLAFWLHLDSKFGAAYGDATTAGNKEIRTAFEKAKRGEGNIGYFPAEALTLNFAGFCAWFVKNESLLNRSATVHALAQKVRLTVPDAPEALGDTYLGVIDAFVDAFSLRAMLDAGQMRTPGRNDALDLAHFLFIQPGTLLATGDTKMGETATGIGLTVVPPQSLLPEGSP